MDDKYHPALTWFPPRARPSAAISLDVDDVVAAVDTVGAADAFGDAVGLGAPSADAVFAMMPVRSGRQAIALSYEYCGALAYRR